MQTIYRIPDIDVSRYNFKKTSRRGTAKYDQVLEQTLNRIQELSKMRYSIQPPLLSTCIPISGQAIESNDKNNENNENLFFLEERNTRGKEGERKRKILEAEGTCSTSASSTTSKVITNTNTKDTSVNGIRRKFREIVGNSLSPSSNGLFPRAMSAPTIATMPLLSSSSSLSNRESNSFNGDNNRKREENNISGSSGKKRHLRTFTPIDSNSQHYISPSPHYNLPWSEDEKKKLDELLLIYPEEEIQSRRYAKIAAAMGTRTASQIGNRVGKLGQYRSVNNANNANFNGNNMSKVSRTQTVSPSTLSNGNENLNNNKNNDNKRKKKIMKHDADENDYELDDLPSNKKNSLEYREYLKLRAELIALENQ